MKNLIKKLTRVERLGTPSAKFPVTTLKTNSWPGVCSIIGFICMIEGLFFPALSANLLAILLGFAARNFLPIPEILEPGIGIAAKRMLRWGVALLGFQVSLSMVLDLGWGVLITDISAVSITFIATLIIGRAMGIDEDLVSLIAAGFSICGAAAVAGIQGTVKATEEKVAAAVALVVLFGTIMIGVGPLIFHFLHLSVGNGATLIGASTHEVAQAAAAAELAGGGILLTTAVVVKLFRVALMAPIVLSVGLFRRKQSRDKIRLVPGQRSDYFDNSKERKVPALLPLFVLAFILFMLLATLNIIPETVQAKIKWGQQFFLTTAMFGLGLGVHIKSLRKLGLKPIILGLCSTLIILLVVLICLSLGLGASL